MKRARGEVNVVDAAEKDQVKDRESDQNTACEKRRVPKGKPEGYSAAQSKNLV
ncbi:MAG: hypothetical protein A4E65_00878 [Syntrophorhabdus sp. PtaU1.Bin153]|nr:MAG: hypothetical protein A4E65_00878 [Syntrophorhabdus sp. PtaU1.Bin153]